MAKQILSSKFITFEGPEGAGKSTQARLLADAIRQTGAEVVLTREPGGTPLAEELRTLVKQRRRELIAPQTEAFIIAAARAQHCAEVILPALRRGAVVICDRFSDSTLAYQGYARGMSIATLHRMSLFASGGREPDLTILIDVDPGCGFGRVRGRDARASANDRFEIAGDEFHRKVRAGFLELARKNPARIRLIAGNRAPEEVHRNVLEVVHDAF